MKPHKLPNTCSFYDDVFVPADEGDRTVTVVIPAGSSAAVARETLHRGFHSHLLDLDGWVESKRHDNLTRESSLAVFIANVDKKLLSRLEGVTKYSAVVSAPPSMLSQNVHEAYELAVAAYKRVVAASSREKAKVDFDHARDKKREEDAKLKASTLDPAKELEKKVADVVRATLKEQHGPKNGKSPGGGRGQNSKPKAMPKEKSKGKGKGQKGQTSAKTPKKAKDTPKGKGKGKGKPAKSPGQPQPPKCGGKGGKGGKGKGAHKGKQ